MKKTAVEVDDDDDLRPEYPAESFRGMKPNPYAGQKMIYKKNYNPTGNAALSTVVAAIPILVLGPIFRKVWWHSVAGAAVIGVIAMLQAYVFG